MAYYRRDGLAFLRSGLRVSRHAFGLSWKATIQCSWLVLRANQLWAPFPGNDPERFRRMMERFYRIVQQLYAEPFDPATAADLEVEWWRVHRDDQRSTSASDGPVLADALARLYSHVYGVPERSVRPAAEQRALAMRSSDQWVSEGCHPEHARQPRNATHSSAPTPHCSRPSKVLSARPALLPVPQTPGVRCDTVPRVSARSSGG